MKEKLTSRKFWIAIITIITGILGVFGVADNTIEMVSSILLILVPGIVYIFTEGKIDASAVTQIDIDSFLEKLKNLLSDEEVKPEISE
ncbi:hypothetical protein LPY66_18095 [Dehalobacter sp. DCM]|uniref:hypothetical protein n=1 Tax=Dehalobacter sp. DCM TaxID=2907827 RepID=UPI0030821B2D|nr:hypothetical protein LPY66_18095 [Dehalobacter sp. DCM]